MNLASIVILAVILIITGFAIFKTVRSKGACEHLSGQGSGGSTRFS